MRINDFSYILIRQFKYLIWLMFFFMLLKIKVLYVYSYS